MPLKNATGISVAFGEHFSGIKRKSGKWKGSWRLDFVADNPTQVRARLRRGSGKSRNNVYDESGNVLVRNYVPLGRIEDVYNNPKYREWKRRCEQYCQTTGYEIKEGGRSASNDSGTPETGVAGLTLDQWSSVETGQLSRPL